MNDAEPTPAHPGRRNFCRVCIGGLSAASAAMVAYPVIGFFQRPERLSSGKPVEIPLANLSVGQAQYVDNAGQAVIVMLGADGKAKVFAASCPHLGCNVSWFPADGVFRCPCHGAVFNPEGVVIHGPVSGKLADVPFELSKDGKIITINAS